MTLQAWCAYEGGPILVAAYQPLQTILVAILSYVFLEETLSLGRLAKWASSSFSFGCYFGETCTITICYVSTA
mgnify:CR=1 FL=1